MNTCLIQRTVVRCHEKGATWDRGVRGSSINKAFTEKHLRGILKDEFNYNRQNLCMWAFWCDIMVGISGRGWNRRRATEVGEHKMCLENCSLFGLSRSSSPMLVGEEMLMRLERRWKWELRSFKDQAEDFAVSAVHLWRVLLRARGVQNWPLGKSFLQWDEGQSIEKKETKSR